MPIRTRFRISGWLSAAACCALFLARPAPGLSSGTYIPPPPPRNIPKYDEKILRQGVELFQQGIWRQGALTIYHHLGPRPCAQCHAAEKGFDAKKLASHFDQLDLMLLRCVRDRAEGDPSFLDPATRQALKTYLFYTYKLHRYRLS